VASIRRELEETEADLQRMLEGSGWKTRSGRMCGSGYEHSIVMIPDNASEIEKKVKADTGCHDPGCGGVSVYWRRHVQLVGPSFGPGSADSVQYGEFTSRGWRSRLVAAAHAACTAFALQHGSTPPSPLALP
jgi:hypothetical protein